MYKNPVNNGGIYHINWLAGFLPSTVWPHSLWKRHLSHLCPVHPWAKAVGLDVGRHPTSAWWTSDLNTRTLSVYICCYIYIYTHSASFKFGCLCFSTCRCMGHLGPWFHRCLLRGHCQLCHTPIFLGWQKMQFKRSMNSCSQQLKHANSEHDICKINNFHMWKD